MRLGHVGAVRRRRAQAVDQPRPRIRAGVQLHPENHCRPFLVWCISGSRARSRFFVDDGALMIVESTIVPSLTCRPRAARCALMVAKSAVPS